MLIQLCMGIPWGAPADTTTMKAMVDRLNRGDEPRAVVLGFRPADAAAYYGPDNALRDFLTREADTWRPVHREAKGNALQPIAKRGRITKSYPLIIAVDDEQRAQVTVKGGLGHVPVVLTGLKTPNGQRVLVNGQPITHWQTDWDAAAQHWRIVCNVAASEEGTMEFVLDGSK